MPARCFQIALFFMIAACAAGCSTTRVPAVHSMGGTLQAGAVTIKGRVMSAALVQAPGASLSIYQVTDDGKLAPLPAESMSVDQDGHYSVDITQGAEHMSWVLVRADSDVGFGLVVVPTELMVERTIPASPMNDATTVQAQVFLTAKASGVWPAGMSVTRLHGFIGERLASATLHDKEYSAAMGILGHATAAAAQSWEQTLSSKPIGVRSELLKTTLAALDWSRFTLAEGLNGAHTVQDETLARADFEAEVPLMYGLASIRPYQLAAAAQASAETFAFYARLLKGESQAQALGDMEAMRASYVTAMVDETVAAIAPAAQRRQAKAQGEALRVRLDHCVGTHGDPALVRTSIRGAWTDYRQAVESSLKVGLSQTPAFDWPRAQQAMNQQAERTAEALGDLDASGPPQQVAERVSRAITDLYVAAQTQAADLAGNDQPQERARAQAVLVVLGSLAVAAR